VPASLHDACQVTRRAFSLHLDESRVRVRGLVKNLRGRFRRLALRRAEVSKRDCESQNKTRNEVLNTWRRCDQRHRVAPASRSFAPWRPPRSGCQARC